MELLIGVLLASVVVNLALLVWLSRADHVKVHWSRPFRALTGSMRTGPAEPDDPPVRRRALFVAEGPSTGDPAPATRAGDPSMPGSGPFSFASPAPGSRTQLADVLPPDLADLLNHPATIAPHPNGTGGSAPGDEDGAEGAATPAPFEADADRQIVARLPAVPRDNSPGIALDPITGLEGPESWSRIMAIENARLLRYRRPASIVLAEVEGLRRLAERLGDEPVDRLLPVIADAFRREARASDWVARIGFARFAAFLPETDEIQAINYIERIRLVCEPWLASAAVPLRLAIGWSSPTASSDLEFAIARAEERMHADRRMPGRTIQPPRVVPARVVSLPPAGRDGADPPGELGAAVPPVETGRLGEWIRAQTGLESSSEAPADEVSQGKGRPDQPRSTSGSIGGMDP